MLGSIGAVGPDECVVDLEEVVWEVSVLDFSKCEEMTYCCARPACRIAFSRRIESLDRGVSPCLSK